MSFGRPFRRHLAKLTVRVYYEMNLAGRASSGFTLVEALVVLVILGLLASVIVPSVTEGPNAAKLTKLKQDVVIVNNAIDAYLAAGGSQGAMSEGSVIESLKNRISGGVTAEMTGPMGPFLDSRVVTNATDFDYSAIFETSPSPRFVVKKSTNGVVFAKGLPSAVGGPSVAANPSWLWSYSPSDPVVISNTIYDPVVSEDGTTPSGGSPQGSLYEPIISPATGTYGLTNFPMSVTIDNPNDNGLSIVYFRVGDTGSWRLWDGIAFDVNPGSKVSAIAVSLDPSSFSNSEEARETYSVSPLALQIEISAPQDVTYAQAGGRMVNTAPLAPAYASITLVNVTEIPTSYLSTSYISMYYTRDGSDPADASNTNRIPAPSTLADNVLSVVSGFVTSFSADLSLSRWGTSTNITFRAVALAANTNYTDWFAPGTSTSEATRTTTPIALQVIPENPIGLPPQVQILETGVVPEGLRKYYTTSGAAPLTSASGGLPTDAATLYAGPINSGLPSSSYTFTAQGTGPGGYESWFSSAAVVRGYNTVSSLPPEFVGANISGGDVNGTFTGSIFVSAPAELGIFNADGQITGGNLYVPGLPAIEIPGSGNSSKEVVQGGQAYVENGEIPRTRVAGKEFTAGGQLADPQLDTRQVVDLSGATTPTNYTVKLTKNAYIEGKIYRRADAPPPPTVPTVPEGLPVNSTNFTGVYTSTIASGVYSNNINMNNPATVLQLGTPGSLSKYIFTGNTWNKGTVEVLGPVEIYFLDGFNNKGVKFGDTNNIVLGSTASLRINVMTNAVDLSGGAEVYANLWGAGSEVKVGNGSFFYGSIYAKTLKVDPGGTVDVQ